jgi:hydrogenase/urease accessory protein HupE
VSMTLWRGWMMTLVALAGFATPALAHEVKPALLEARASAADQFNILWKQPVTDGRRLKLTPVLPEDCRETGSRRIEADPQYIIQRWQVACALDSGAISIDGLDRSLTDVFARIIAADGSIRTRLIRPDDRAWDLAEAEQAQTIEYLWIGVEHMVFGLDHLLFVTGLALLVAWRQLIWVITSFTIAHSITLALTALGWVSLPGTPVEILIAMSIVLLAVEIMRKRRGQPSLAARRPWLVAFAIGLVHGLGFAGALAEIGLPPGEELWALLLFNLGLELGQIAFVLALLGGLWLIARISMTAQDKGRLALTYAIGSIGCFWVIQRVLAA